MSQSVSTEKLIEGNQSTFENDPENNLSKNLSKNPEKNSSWFQQNKPLAIGLIILAVIVIIGIIVTAIIIVAKKSPKNKPEGFTSTTLGKDTSIEINGNIIDCKPEIDYMKQFIQSSIGID